MEWSPTFILSAMLAISVPMALAIGYFNRRQSGNAGGKGIGWQFIRYTVLAISLPIVGVLALNGSLSGEAAALIGGAMGYAFGKDDRRRRRRTRPESKA